MRICCSRTYSFAFLSPVEQTIFSESSSASLTMSGRWKLKMLLEFAVFVYSLFVFMSSSREMERILIISSAERGEKSRIVRGGGFQLTHLGSLRCIPNSFWGKLPRNSLPSHLLVQFDWAFLCFVLRKFFKNTWRTNRNWRTCRCNVRQCSTYWFSTWFEYFN